MFIERDLNKKTSEETSDGVGLQQCCDHPQGAEASSVLGFLKLEPPVDVEPFLHLMVR